MKLFRTLAVAMMGLLLLYAPARSFTVAPTFDPALAQKADKKFDRATYDRLQKIMVSVNWQKSPPAALKDLESKMQSADRQGAGIKFSIDLNQGDPKLAKAVPGKVQILVSDANVWDILAYFSQQTNLIPLIHKGHVIMIPGRETRVSFPQDFQQPANVR